MTIAKTVKVVCILFKYKSNLEEISVLWTNNLNILTDFKELSNVNIEQINILLFN
jgi:hypothetical protein